MMQARMARPGEFAKRLPATVATPYRIEIVVLDTQKGQVPVTAIISDDPKRVIAMLAEKHSIDPKYFKIVTVPVQ